MKKICFILLFFILASIPTLHAQVASDAVYEINDFSKLLQSLVNPYLIPKNAAIEARNVRANKVFGALSKRNEMNTYGSMGSFAVTGLHRYYKSDDTKYLIAGGSTYLKYGDDDAGTFIVLRNELTDGQHWDCVTYMDTAICFNGSDNAQKWDGHTTTTANTDGARTVNILTADLGAPYAELNTGANLDASKWYQYKIAYYDGSTYKFSNARSNPILTGSSIRNIALTDIPLGVSGTTHRYVYRTLDNSSRANVEADTTFYKVATIADNTTTTLADTMTDATAAGDAAPTWSTVAAGTDVSPPACKFALIHNERLWAANKANYKSDIYWSQAYLPNYFVTGTDYEQIRPDDGDEITVLENLLGIITIVKNNSIQKFLTDAITSTGAIDTNRWSITDPFSIIGTSSPYSAVISPLGMIYLALDGIYVFNGEKSQIISEVIAPEIADISLTDREKTAAVFNNNEYRLAYTSEKSGAAANNRVLIMDTLKDSYVIDDKSINVFEVFNSGTDFGTVYSGSSGTDGNILAHSTSPSLWTLRYKSDLDKGTMDSVITYGIEILPYAEIGWGVTIDSVTMAGVTLDSVIYADAIIDRPGLTGTWWSAITEVDATDYDKLYWNEDLGTYGDLTFAVRSGATSGAVASASWSSEFSDPTGADLSGETANDYVQLRASFSTTDILESPLLYQNNNYVLKLAYNKEGAAAETNIYSTWKGGYSNLGVEGQASHNPKRLKRIIVFYEGTAGTLTIGYNNSDGDIDESFDIDMSMHPDDDDPYGDNNYTGNDIEKIYTYWLPVNQTGIMWQFSVDDTGTDTWTINKIKVIFDVDEML